MSRKLKCVDIYRGTVYRNILMGRPRTDHASDATVAEKVRAKTPKLYKVVILNDDYTTMEFVVNILETVFMKSASEAVQIMLHVHKAGRGIAGIFTKQIAEAKIEIAHQRAKNDGFPLRCLLEEE